MSIRGTARVEDRRGSGSSSVEIDKPEIDIPPVKSYHLAIGTMPPTFSFRLSRLNSFETQPKAEGAMRKIGQQTIQDFGRQHQAYPKIEGYAASTEILSDIVGPLMDIGDFKGLNVLDLGSGQGRWLRVFNELGAKEITSVEPSSAIEICRKNTEDLDNITYHHVAGDKMPDGDYDVIFSYGVIHHIPEPAPVIDRAFEILKPGGKIVIWLYGRENNGLYLAFANTMRVLTVRFPHAWLDKLCGAMVPVVRLYSRICKIVPLPMHRYMAAYIDRIDDFRVKNVIYDQLNPHYAKYYRRDEAVGLLEKAGFADVQVYHRQKYSWTATGTKSA